MKTVLTFRSHAYLAETLLMEWNMAKMTERVYRHDTHRNRLLLSHFAICSPIRALSEDAKARVGMRAKIGKAR